MIDLEQYRRFFAEEIEAIARLQTPALVDALAIVPRERFLRPGPWTILADTDFMPGGPAKTRTTVDADPRRVYHNIAVAIDPARQLFNGQPATLTAWLDALGLTGGARVLHVGAGLGYYTAVLAQAVGQSGRVVAVEVDASLAAEARANLASMSWVSVVHGDASQTLDDMFDAILVNAGVTHPLDVWLDALAPGGRMILPLTATVPAMGSTIGKGLVCLLTKQESDTDCAAHVVSMVAVYSAVGLRNEDLNTQLGRAMMAGPPRWQSVTRLRRDAHEPSSSCWLHCQNCCLSCS